MKARKPNVLMGFLVGAMLIASPVALAGGISVRFSVPVSYRSRSCGAAPRYSRSYRSYRAPGSYRGSGISFSYLSGSSHIYIGTDYPRYERYYSYPGYVSYSTGRRPHVYQTVRFRDERPAYRHVRDGRRPFSVSRDGWHGRSHTRSIPSTTTYRIIRACP